MNMKPTVHNTEDASFSRARFPIRFVMCDDAMTISSIYFDE